jgi:hypothetical protein
MHFPNGSATFNQLHDWTGLVMYWIRQEQNPSSVLFLGRAYICSKSYVKCFLPLKHIMGVRQQFSSARGLSVKVQPMVLDSPSR